jgi:hypothetical protein
MARLRGKDTSALSKGEGLSRDRERALCEPRDSPNVPIVFAVPMDEALAHATVIKDVIGAMKSCTASSRSSGQPWISSSVRPRSSRPPE